MTRYVFHAWPNHPRPYTAHNATNAALATLSESDPVKLAATQAEVTARLIGTLADKGLLLPSEVVKVLGYGWSIEE